jgi:tetratricopeptide (TPR) repeat protein
MHMPSLKTNSEARKGYRSAVRLNNLAAKYQSQGNASRPEKLYLRALQIKETLLGADHPDVAFTLNNLGVFYRATGRAGEARRLLERALAIFQSSLGASHPNVGATLLNLSQAMQAEARAIEHRAKIIQRAARETADPRQIAKAVIRHDRARYRLSAQPSRIHRFGVFAGEAIPAGRKIIEYTGQRISRR